MRVARFSALAVLATVLIILGRGTPPRVFAAGSPQSIWPISGHDAQRRSRSTFAAAANPLTARWSKSLGARLSGDLVVSAEGVIYVSSDHLYALNADGTSHASALFVQPLSTPAIDDLRGFVYVAITSLSVQGSWDIIRLTKDLQQPLVLYTSPARSIAPKSLTIGSNGGVYFFDRHDSNSDVVAVGGASWRHEFFGIAASAQPILGLDDILYLQIVNCCGGDFLKLDPNTGTPLLDVQSSSSSFGNWSLGDDGLLRGGATALTGVQFVGWFATYDTNFNQLSIQQPADETGSVPAVLPDGSSTIHLGLVANGQARLVREGPIHWDTALTMPETFISAPSLDAHGRTFVGRTHGLSEIDSSSGSEIAYTQLPDDISTPPIVMPDGRLVLASASGVVYAVGPVPQCTLPEIVGPIAGQTITAGQPVTLSVQSNGASLTYQWYLAPAATFPSQLLARRNPVLRVVRFHRQQAIGFW